MPPTAPPRTSPNVTSCTNADCSNSCFKLAEKILLQPLAFESVLQGLSVTGCWKNPSIHGGFLNTLPEALRRPKAFQKPTKYSGARRPPAGPSPPKKSLCYVGKLKVLWIQSFFQKSFQARLVRFEFEGLAGALAALQVLYYKGLNNYPYCQCYFEGSFT